MKKIIAFFLFLSLVACASASQNDSRKTLKAKSASDRINSSSENNQGLFKDLE